MKKFTSIVIALISISSFAKQTHTAEEVAQTITALHEMDFVIFSAGISTGASVYRYYPDVYHALKAKALFPKIDGQLEKTATLLARPENACIASTLISFHEVLTKHQNQFKKIIETRYDRELKEARQAKLDKQQAEAKGNPYYGRSTEAYPRSTYIGLSFTAMADFHKEISPFLDRTPPDIANALKVDIYGKPLLRPSHWGETNKFELKWYIEALTERFGPKYTVGDDYKSCNISPLRLAHKLGMRAQDVRSGHLDRLVNSL